MHQHLVVHLLAAKVVADGGGFGGEAVAEDWHGGCAVLVDEGNAVSSAVTEGVAVEESGNLLQDTGDKVLVLSAKL